MYIFKLIIIEDYIGVDEIGANVELDTLAQQLAYLNQPTQNVHI